MASVEDKSWGGGNPDEAPEYVHHRLKVWDEIVAKRQAQGAKKSTDKTSITISLSDGNKTEGIKGETTPIEIAKSLGENIAREAMVALVDENLWDMTRPLVGDCSLKICNFETPQGKSVFWHSTAHMLGEAMEYKFKGELCIGPPLEDGFYYDIHLGEGRTVQDEAFKDLEKRIERISKSQRKFERLELEKDEARAMFSYNKFKMELIEKLEEGTTITAYRDGPFIDLCRGPHVPNSAKVKTIMVRKTGSAYWLGKVENPSLQRVYGISFPDKAQMKAYKTLLAEAAKRDHRVIGKDQKLFMFNQLSPGSAFLLPHGARIYNTLVEFLRDEYWRRGYEEVGSPNVFDFQLWETSGHAGKYKENMFSFDVEKREFGVKPMNCPGHCLIYGSTRRSYRELPMRMAEFGVLHRNELSGTLAGLTRVRRFVQDDSHIFCTPEQVKTEVIAFLDFMKHVYDIFGFTFELELSTRPKNYLGEVETWAHAEQMLTEALDEFTDSKCGEGWQLNPGDGAFYGPKIDIKLYDALKRRHQCATCQLDFQLPIRFDLWYHGPGTQEASNADGDGSTEAGLGPDLRSSPVTDVEQVDTDQTMVPTEAKTAAGGKHRPVIVHRAIYGSLERFFAILTEHYAGKWPFWLSPRQVIVVPVDPKFIDYSREVQEELRKSKFFADVDATDRKLAKKVREAQLAQYNFILVVGQAEVDERSVNVRTRENAVQGSQPLLEFRKKLETLRSEHM